MTGPPPSSAKDGRSIPVTLIVTGVLVICLLLAGGGGLVWWRGRSPSPVSPPTSRATSTDPAALEGVWELAYDGPLYRITLTAEPNGRVRLLEHFLCYEGAKSDAGRYLELSPAGERRWTGSGIAAWLGSLRDATGAYTAADTRGPIQRIEGWLDSLSGEAEGLDPSADGVSLSADGITMTWSTPQLEHLLIWHRAERAETVVLEIVNEMDVDVTDLHVDRSADPSFMFQSEDRLVTTLEPGEACRMTLPPDIYHLRAWTRDFEVALRRDDLRVDEDATLVMEGYG